MLQEHFDTAVLFLVFNRIKQTKKVFNEIKKVQPKRLYIASDGPRDNYPSDVKQVHEIREFLSKNIDWSFSVRTLYRNKNLGCKFAVSQAISWFFENESQGIILEDDILPNETFFKFCHNALNIFKSKPNIGAISGTNLLSDAKKNDQCYSLHGSVWGWASWADRWQSYDVEDIRLSILDCLKYATSLSEFIHILRIKRHIKSAKYNSWDYQWLFLRIKKDWLTVMPKYNYIQNIGFESGTHCNGEMGFSYPRSNKSYYLVDSRNPSRNTDYDKDLWNYKNE